MMELKYEMQAVIIINKCQAEGQRKHVCVKIADQAELGFRLRRQS